MDPRADWLDSQYIGGAAMNYRKIRFPILVLMWLMLWLVGCINQSVSSTGGFNQTAIEMWASDKCVKPGETVKLRATVTNHGKTIEQTELKDQPVLDIIVGSTRWSDGKPLTPDLTRLELKPDESRTIEMDWVMPQDVGNGFFIAEARYIYNQSVSGGPIRVGVTIHAFGYCPGFGP